MVHYRILKDKTLEELWPFIDECVPSSHRIIRYSDLYVEEHSPAGSDWPGPQKNIVEWVRVSGRTYCRGWGPSTRFVDCYVGRTSKNKFYFATGETYQVKPRDNQKQKVYRAERCFKDDIGDDNSRFPTFELAEQYGEKIANDIIQMNIFTADWQKKKLIGLSFVHHKRKNAKKGWYRPITNTISLPLFAWNEVFILHEITHVITQEGVADHGKEFCQNFIKLVTHFKGDNAALQLMYAYDALGVKY